MIFVHAALFLCAGRSGVGGIRTLDRILSYTRLAGERLQPLGHHSSHGRSPLSSLSPHAEKLMAYGHRPLFYAIQIVKDGQPRPPLPVETERRRRDSNPRYVRTTVFKTAALNHSATPPAEGAAVCSTRCFAGARKMRLPRPARRAARRTPERASYDATSGSAIRSTPIQGRSTSGTVTEPSAF
jgi:hypothetical protein